MLVSMVNQNCLKRAKINYVDYFYTPLGPLIVENRFFGTPPGYPKGSTSFMDAPKNKIVYYCLNHLHGKKSFDHGQFVTL